MEPKQLLVCSVCSKRACSERAEQIAFCSFLLSKKLHTRHCTSLCPKQFIYNAHTAVSTCNAIVYVSVGCKSSSQNPIHCLWISPWRGIWHDIWMGISSKNSVQLSCKHEIISWLLFGIRLFLGTKAFIPNVNLLVLENNSYLRSLLYHLFLNVLYRVTESELYPACRSVV